MTNKEAKSIFFFEANTKENRNEHYREACKLAYVALDRMEGLEQEENPDTYSKLFGTAKNDLAQERYQDLIEYFSDEKVAKTILESRKEFKAWLERLKWNVKRADELARELEQMKSTTKNDLAVDCISRADVLQILLDYDYANENALVIKDIKALPSVTSQEPRWISVSEKLPKDFETVIASVDKGYVYPEARYSKEKGWEWAYESGAEIWKKIECDVIAWMPLPKPYEPQESEDKE